MSLAPGHVDFGILDNLQLVLLLLVEELAECIGDQGGEKSRDVRHAAHLVFVCGSKSWEILW